jgi:hypothetical protein
MKKIYLLASLSLLASTTALPMQFIQKIDDSISNFIKKSLDAHTYDFNSPKHRKFLAFTYLLPENMGQYYLYRQRQNMKKFLEQNEKNAIEGLRTLHDIDNESWDRIMKRRQEFYDVNLQRLKDTTNQNEVLDEKNIPAEWIQALKSASNKLGINYRNVDLTIDDTIEMISGSKTYLRNLIFFSRVLPSWITRPPWTLMPSQIILNKSKLDSENIEYTTHAIEHELTHAIKGHGMLWAALHAEKPRLPFSLIPSYEKEINTYDKMIQSTQYKYDRIIYDSKPQRKRIKKDKKTGNIIIRCSYPERDYFLSLEKTADTLLACDYPDSARNAHDIAYHFNRNDLKTLNANWETAEKIQQSRDMMRSAQKNLSKLSSLMPSIKFNLSPFKKSSTFTLKPSQFTKSLSDNSTTE